MCGGRRIAIEKNREFAASGNRDHDVRRPAADAWLRRARQTEAEFARKRPEALLRNDCVLELGGNLANIRPLRIKPTQRVDDDVAHCFRTGLGIDKAGGIERRQRLRVCLGRDAAQLQITAIGQIDFARTEALRCLGNGKKRRHGVRTRRRSDAEQQSVTRPHRPQRSRTPAFAQMGGCDHSAASRGEGGLTDESCAGAEMSLRRGCQRPRATASSNRLRIASIASGFSRAINAATTGSPR